MKLNGNEIRPGMMIEYDGSLWIAVKTMAVKPGKGPAYNQVELKNLTGKTVYVESNQTNCNRRY